jgi:hypothetical protein
LKRFRNNDRGQRTFIVCVHPARSQSAPRLPEWENHGTCDGNVARLQELIARSEMRVAQSRRVAAEMHEQSERINRL